MSIFVEEMAVPGPENPDTQPAQSKNRWKYPWVTDLDAIQHDKSKDSGQRAVVLSFLSLQRRRIEMLQDEILRLLLNDDVEGRQRGRGETLGEDDYPNASEASIGNFSFEEDGPPYPRTATTDCPDGTNPTAVAVLHEPSVGMALDSSHGKRKPRVQFNTLSEKSALPNSLVAEPAESSSQKDTSTAEASLPTAALPQATLSVESPNLKSASNFNCTVEEIPSTTTPVNSPSLIRSFEGDEIFGSENGSFRAPREKSVVLPAPVFIADHSPKPPGTAYLSSIQDSGIRSSKPEIESLPGSFASSFMVQSSFGSFARVPGESLRGRRGLQFFSIDDLLDKYARALQTYETLSQNAISEVPQGYDFVGRAAEVIEGLMDGQGRKAFSARWFHSEPYVRAHQINSTNLTPTPWYQMKTWARLFFFGKAGPAARHAIKVGAFEAEYETAGKNKSIYIRGGFRELGRKGRIERELRDASIGRLSMAFFGGVALIVPTIIMSFKQTLKVLLITTSVSTIVFGFVLAFSMRESPGKDVLGATAAYAAVLVVFVGTSLATLASKSS